MWIVQVSSYVTRNPSQAGLGFQLVRVSAAGVIMYQGLCRDELSPPDPVGLVSKGGEVIKLHIEGSLTISTTGIIRV